MNSSNTRSKYSVCGPRSVYLITYSQADLSTFSTRESFAQAIVEKFHSHGAEVTRWECCKENHVEEGVHYHLAVKLDRVKRRLTIRNEIHQDYNININFSEHHTNYYNAWRYVTKSDQDFVQSKNHPDLTSTTEPRTTAASRKKKTK